MHPLRIARTLCALLAVVSAPLALAGCSPSTDGPRKSERAARRGSTDESRDERTTLRDHARTVLEENCGRCHLPRLPTSSSAALGVFDLSQREWAARMSERQLRDAAARLASDLAPFGHDGVPMAVSDRDRALFERYVKLELERRAARTGMR